jgi:NADH-quinone oxidoreductase subunit H
MHYEFTWFHFWVTLILIAAILGAVQGTCAYLILAERKISAWAQDRVGPNRVGPAGLLQPIADGIKFLFKEQVVPAHVDKLFYLSGPMVAISTALLAIAVVPVGPTTAPPAVPWPQTKAELDAIGPDVKAQVAAYNDTVQFVIAPHVDIGVVFVFAVGSLAAYAIVLGGWSSNNKYSFLGGLRSSAQLISYEIPLGMSVLGVFLLCGSLNVERIIDYQTGNGWNILFQPLAFVLFATSIFAETNRLPFDLPEAEQELVGGYHTEYSGMKFALFFLGEYTHMITTSFLVVALFFGGWHLPFVAPADSTGVLAIILKLLLFAGKMALFIVFYMLIRWTIPRFRFDQLMGLAWKVMMPLALVNLVAVLYVKHFEPQIGEWAVWLLLPISLVILVAATLLSLRMPRPRARAPVTYEGHPVTGARPVLADHGERGA